MNTKPALSAFAVALVLRAYAKGKAPLPPAADTSAATADVKKPVDAPEQSKTPWIANRPSWIRRGRLDRSGRSCHTTRGLGLGLI
jgi:hypothetical protein